MLWIQIELCEPSVPAGTSCLIDSSQIKIVSDTGGYREILFKSGHEPRRLTVKDSLESLQTRLNYETLKKLSGFDSSAKPGIAH